MKNVFNVVVITLAFVVSFAFYFFVMGNPENFKDGEQRKEPKPGNVLGTVYTGGPLVAVLLGLVLISITFVFERSFSLKKARGNDDLAEFIKRVQKKLEEDDIEGALAECDKQRGSLANILRAGLEKYLAIKDDPTLDSEKKLLEVKRVIDEATNLETPLLEKNLVILSTIASIATMVGLLGTTIGMIRAFMALGLSGAVSAVQLAIGISEALYNTAGGLAGAIISIVFYNYFTTKVDDFTYMMDEAILSITELLGIKLKK